MSESQNIEWKEQWRDEYLKWVCGFANANGGKIFIGKDNSGNITGISNYQELLVKLPNKIKDHLGILVDINLLEKNSKKYIEINIPPSSAPVSLRGGFYYRTGSTNKQLDGSSLVDFLLKKAGKTWDDCVEESATIEDIDEETILIYKKAVESSGRFPSLHSLTTEQALEKLDFIKDGHLKRGAIILFGKRPSKFYSNRFVKIGRFGTSDTDLKFQEVIEGNLITCLHKTVEMLENKFLIKNIKFEGVMRIETLEYPPLAIREALLNALIHQNYSGSMIQIRVCDDNMSIWNDGKLPKELTSESLRVIHQSIPRNPLVADACFKAGYIDSWGRGTTKIIEESLKGSLLDPEFIEMSGGFLVTLRKSTTEVTTEVTTKIRILSLLNESKLSQSEIRTHLNLKNEAHMRKAYIVPMLADKLIEMTIPDKPKSRFQKYRITLKGQKYLNENKKA